MRIEIGLQALGLKSRELWAKRLQVARRRWLRSSDRSESYGSCRELPQSAADYTGLAPAAAAIAAVSLLTFEKVAVAG